MPGYCLALSAVDTVRINHTENLLQAGFLIGEHLVELMDSELLHCVTFPASDTSVARTVRAVKGYFSD